MYRTQTPLVLADMKNPQVWKAQTWFSRNIFPFFFWQLIKLVHSKSQVCPNCSAIQSQFFSVSSDWSLNQFVIKVELFHDFLEHCYSLFLFGGGIWIPSNFFGCINQVIPQRHDVVEIWFNPFKILGQAKDSVIVSFEHFRFTSTLFESVVDQ